MPTARPKLVTATWVHRTAKITWSGSTHSATRTPSGRTPSTAPSQLIGQYEYLTRNPWYVALGALDHASDSTIYFDLRYTLPGGITLTTPSSNRRIPSERNCFFNSVHSKLEEKAHEDVDCFGRNSPWPVRRSWRRPVYQRRGRDVPVPDLFEVVRRISEGASGIEINYQSLGSGAGIKQLTEGTVDFGASDMPMKDDADCGAENETAALSDGAGRGRSDL